MNSKTQLPTTDKVLHHLEGATLWLTLNRPAKRNAMDDEMLQGLDQALRHAYLDKAVRTIVITGTGNCLTAGRDLKHVRGADTSQLSLGDQSLDQAVDVFTDLLNLILDAPKPVIAAVRGFAVGGGQALSLACDFVIAESNAKFGNVEISYGFPAAMNAVLLTRHLGRRLAMEIALSGTLRTALEYQQLGLVNRTCEPGELHACTRDFCETFNQRAPWAIRRTKILMKMAEDASLAGAMHLGGQLNQLLQIDSTVRRTYDEGGDIRKTLRSSVAE